MKKKLAIVGSRSFTDQRLFDKLLDSYSNNVEVVISGGARGADTLAERWAKKHNIPCIVYTADWDTYGKRAGYLRNVKIIKECDVCIAFWDGKSKGTQHSISLCDKLNKRCKVIRI